MIFVAFFTTSSSFRALRRLTSLSLQGVYPCGKNGYLIKGKLKEKPLFQDVCRLFPSRRALGSVTNSGNPVLGVVCLAACMRVCWLPVDLGSMR